jgi:hypothetical protein
VVCDHLRPAICGQRCGRRERRLRYCTHK